MLKPLCCMICVGMVAQTPPSPTAKVEVVVEAPKVVIPNLPTSLKAAQVEYRTQVQGWVRAAKELEQDLSALYGVQPPVGPVPKSLRLKGHEAAAARFLALLLNDTEMDRMEVEVEHAFRAWEQELQATVEGSAANSKSKGGTTKSSVHPNEAERRRRGFEMSDQMFRQKAEVYQRMATSKARFDSSLFETLITNLVQTEASRRITQSHLVVAEKALPTMIQAWEPLVQRLNDQAAKLANLEAPQQPLTTPDLLALHHHAKINFLERCRSSLRFAHMTWAHLTSHEPPPPLRDLAPRSAAAPAGQK